MNRIKTLFKETTHRLISRRNPDRHEAFDRRSSWRRVEGRDALERIQRGRREMRKRRRIPPVIERRRPRSGVGGTLHQDSTFFSSLEWLEGGRGGHKLGSPWHCRPGSAETVEVEIQTFAPRPWALDGGRTRPFAVRKAWRKVKRVSGEESVIRTARIGIHHRNCVVSKSPVGWRVSFFGVLCGFGC